MTLRFLIILSFIAISQLIWPQDKPAADPDGLAKKLANPIAGLISFPFQNNSDNNYERNY